MTVFVFTIVNVFWITVALIRKPPLGELSCSQLQCEYENNFRSTAIEHNVLFVAWEYFVIHLHDVGTSECSLAKP